MLNIESLTWENYTVHGLQPSAGGGCLVYYNNILLSALGVWNNRITNKIQLIDFKHKKLLSSSSRIEGQIDTDPSDAEFHNDNNPPGLVIGLVMGSLLLLTLVGIFGACAWMRRKKPKQTAQDDDELRPPELLLGNMWVENYPPLPSSSENDVIGTVSLQETTVPSFDHEVTRPLMLGQVDTHSPSIT